MTLMKISPLVLEDLQTVRAKSPDPSTKCGAVIYDGERFVARGCNTFFKELEYLAEVPNIDMLLGNRNYKLNVIQHAECNCIEHVELRKTRFENKVVYDKTLYSSATMYITSTPCLHCAMEIVRAGIRKVAIVDHDPDFSNPSWGELWRAALDFLTNNDVEVSYYDKSGKLLARVEEGTIVPCGEN